MSTAKDYLYGTLFEDNYLIRSLNNCIITQPDVALTELVANAWDAGATEVKIFIPEKCGEVLTIEDNGVGLTKEEFYSRWMKLSYNRLLHQGKKVLFPNGKTSSRIAYGRNGVGRHGLLCFNDEYQVITRKEGVELSLTVSTKITGQAIAVIDEQTTSSKNQGTILKVVVERNLPTVNHIREIISSRFLHDPQFVIEVNRKRLTLDQLDGLLDTTELTTKDGYRITATFIDAVKKSRKSIYQGIAFWQGGRLVGSPSWILGNTYYVDGRTAIAKRYTVVIQSKDLEDLVKEDWSGFKDTKETRHLYETVKGYVISMFEKVAKANIEEPKAAIKQELKSKLKNATPLALYEVDEIIESITINTPTANKESISLAVEAIVKLESSKNGQELLAKLSNLSEEDIIGLNSILEKWSVKDALTVLSEIDRRLSVIEAIRKLSKDKSVDELHILHPLVTESRWLFGPEYDTPEYTSNRQLQTVVKELFKKSLNNINSIKINKRPDIVVLADGSSISVTGIEDIAKDSSMVIVNKVLIIELKRGGFEITSNERNQAQNYIESLLALGFESSTFNAFVVGDSVVKGLQRTASIGDNKQGHIFVTTFDQLVDTAEKRMFGLRKKLSTMYDDVPGMELYKQTKLKL